MKAYWDSSALVESVWSATIKRRLETERAFARPHALAEIFSALTGNPETRIDAEDATRILERLVRSLDFVDLSPAEILAALKTAKQKGVRGGRVHDFLHAAAAEKCGAQTILTLDRNDFAGLARLVVEQV